MDKERAWVICRGISWSGKQFCYFFGKLVLKMSASNEIFGDIKYNYEIEVDDKMFIQNNADQAKGNAAKLEYANYGKNLNGSAALIQKFLI